MSILFGSDQYNPKDVRMAIKLLFNADRLGLSVKETVHEMRLVGYTITRRQIALAQHALSKYRGNTATAMDYLETRY